MTDFDYVIKIVELCLLGLVAVDRFIAFCYYPSTGGFFTWLFFLVYELILGLSFLNMGFFDKLYSD